MLLRATILSAFVLLLIGLALAGPAIQPEPLKGDERKALPAGVSPETGGVRAEYQLLLSGQVLTSGGVQVTTVNPAGPGARLSRDVDGKAETATLDPGDVILRVNGFEIHQPDDYHRALNASAARQGKAVLTVLDVKTGRVSEWHAVAATIQARVTPPPPPAPPNRARDVKVLLVADTDDPTLGKMVALSLGSVRQLFRDTPGLRQENVRVLVGPAVTAQNILVEVDRLATGPDEALVYYHLGHGGYDPSRAAGDPSGGHFFALGASGGDLLRKVLRDRLTARGARLTVLLSDTCSTRAAASPPPPPPIVGPGQPDYWPLCNLLLDHTGVIDVNGSSRDQYAWFDGVHGGWFSEAFGSSCDAAAYPGEQFVSWDRFLQRVSERTGALYRTRKHDLLRGPGATSPAMLDLLRVQTDQRPQAFVKNIRANQ